MKTIFTMDLAGSRSMFLGQAGGDVISEAERNKILNDLVAAGDKLRAINDWIQSHPNAQAALGTDYQTYQDASANEGHFGSTAATVQQMLASTDPTVWNVSAQQWNDTQNWMTFVNQIYGILQRHGVTATSPSGAPVKPGAPGATPAGTTGGIPTGLLVGGGVAAALIVGALIIK